MPEPDLSAFGAVLVHIQTHLDDDLTLTSLARHAGYSPQHFQRRFAETTGESPNTYVRRLRLQRAAHLIQSTSDPLGRIAERVGYRRYETFSRAFSKAFGTSPRSFRVRRSGWGSSQRPPIEHPWDQLVSMSGVRFEQRRPIPLGFVRQLGDYEKVDASMFDDLIDWRHRRWPADPDGILIGIGHDDPTVTASEQLRYDACITVPEPFTGDDRIGFQTFPEGTYATLTYHGPYGEPLMTAYGTLFEAIAASRRYEPLGLPVIEVYNTTRIDATSSVNTTDLLVPVRLA